MTTTPTTTNIEFHFDFGSPNAYLAHRALPAIEARTGARFSYVPVLLGGVFRATGNRAPMEANQGVINKMDYMKIEMQRFARRHQITKFRMNPHFPINTLALMRGAVAAGQAGVLTPYVEHVYCGMWEEGKKLDDTDTIRAWLLEGGLDADRLLELAQSAEVKAELTANTQRSVDMGTFGSPMFYLGSVGYFGKDGLRELVEDLGAGTKP